MAEPAVMELPRAVLSARPFEAARYLARVERHPEYEGLSIDEREVLALLAIRADAFGRVRFAASRIAALYPKRWMPTARHFARKDRRAVVRLADLGWLRIVRLDRAIGTFALSIPRVRLP